MWGYGNWRQRCVSKIGMAKAWGMGGLDKDVPAPAPHVLHPPLPTTKEHVKSVGFPNRHYEGGTNECSGTNPILKTGTFETTREPKKARHRAHPPHITELQINRNPQSPIKQYHRIRNVEEHHRNLSQKSFINIKEHHRNHSLTLKNIQIRWREGAAARPPPPLVPPLHPPSLPPPHAASRR